MTVPVVWSLYGVWGDESGYVYAVGGNGGTAICYSGTSWFEIPLTQTNTLQSIAVVTKDDVFAVGDMGAMQHNWSKMDNVTNHWLKDAWVSPDFKMYVVGENVTILECTPVFPAPVSQFEASPLSGRPPLSVDFTDRSTGLIASWSWDFGDAVSYDVYFGTTNPPESKIFAGQSSLNCDPGELLPGLTYYWKIVATDQLGESTEGQVWYFSTARPRFRISRLRL